MKILLTRFTLFAILFLFSSKTFSIFLPTNNDDYLAFDAPPTDIIFSGSITENIDYAGTVGFFITVDADAEDTHTYTLVEGAGDADNDKFSIIENELEINSWPNNEIQSVYYIRVRTDDQHGGIFEKAFIIPIQEINEAPQGIVLSTLAIEENNQSGALVSLLSVMDEDTLDHHTYRLVAGVGDEDNAAFTITGNELRAIISFDYETKSNYSIRLQVQDKDNLTYESKFTIIINDLVEVPELDLATPLQEEQEPLGLKVYPNPADHYLHISNDTNIEEVRLVNSAGSQIFKMVCNSRQVQIDLTGLSSGTYIAIIYSNGKVGIKRIIISN